jgi:hypothetical protein
VSVIDRVEGRALVFLPMPYRRSRSATVLVTSRRNGTWQGLERTTAMEYSRLGNTGLKVSRIALGCMSYGDPTTPNAHAWALTEDKAQPFFQQAVELGVTFWDTATSINSVPPRRSSVARSPLPPRGDRPRDEGVGKDA